jgi:oligopeptide transport system substrate-binding protein
LIDQLFSGLVELSPEMEVVPAIAQNWELSDNGRTYLFHLRHDVRWSDGTPVTAADFEYAWIRLLDPATNAPEPSVLYDIRGARAFHQGELSDPEQVGVRALDPLTLRVELEGPTGYFPHLLTLDSTYPLPRHVVEAYGQAWTEVGNIVTNGPFLLQVWDRSERMVLTRNSDYHGQFSGNIERVELSLGSDPAIPLQMYEAGELDILSHFTLRKIPTPKQDWVRQRYANDLISAPGLYTNFMAFDASRPPFDDPGVRRAFVLATDRAALVAARRSNELPATGGFVPPGMPGHSPGIGLSHDPEQARQLLAASGYPAGQGFPTVDMLAFQSHIPFCKSLQAQWRQNLGVDVNWRPLQTSRYINKLADEQVHLCSLAWMADYPDPVNFLDLNDSIQMGQWHSQRFVALVDRARRETAPQQRMELYGQADKILIEEAAIMPLTYGHKHVLVKPWVKKYPISAFKFWFWKDVVIEPH